MKKNEQLVVDLGAAKFTPDELSALQSAIHDAVAAAITKKTGGESETASVNDPSMEKNTAATTAVNIVGKTADLLVEFRTVDAGLSDLTATHKGASQTIHQSDTISFPNVNVGDLILIKGDSAGTTKVTISGVNAVPPKMAFAAGQHINGIFLIKP